jgi:hypothetical protein
LASDFRRIIFALAAFTASSRDGMWADAGAGGPIGGASATGIGGCIGTHCAREVGCTPIGRSQFRVDLLIKL